MDQMAIDHAEHQYRYSRSHASHALLRAMKGFAPSEDLYIRILHPEARPACGESFRFALVVKPDHAQHPGYEVTCPKCRVLMRLIRPVSAPLYEMKEYSLPTGRVVQVGYVGGEQLESVLEFAARVDVDRAA